MALLSTPQTAQNIHNSPNNYYQENQISLLRPTDYASDNDSQQPSTPYTYNSRPPAYLSVIAENGGDKNNQVGITLYNYNLQPPEYSSIIADNSGDKN